MDLSGLKKLFKIILIVYNIVFWLTAFALIGVGIWLLVDADVVEYLKVIELSGDDPLLRKIAFVLIAVGTVVFFVGFLGMAGACFAEKSAKWAKIFLGFYITALLLIMGLELAAAILAVIYKTQLEQTLSTKLSESAHNDYGKEGETTITGAWDFAQSALKCCGGLNGYDYADSQYSESNDFLNYPLPRTCCQLSNRVEIFSNTPIVDSDYVSLSSCRRNSINYLAAGNPQAIVDYQHVNLIGCYPALIDWLKGHVNILIAVGCSIAAVEVLGFAFAVSLCRSVVDGQFKDSFDDD